MRKALLVLALAVTACGDGSGDGDGDTFDPLGDTPSCEEWTERAVTAEEVEFGCRDGDSLAGTSTTDCRDGRVLYWNDRVWGYVDEPAQEHEPGAELVAPELEREACDA